MFAIERAGGDGGATGIIAAVDQKNVLAVPLSKIGTPWKVLNVRCGKAIKRMDINHYSVAGVFPHQSISRPSPTCDTSNRS
jgi:hypothetical protein